MRIKNNEELEILREGGRRLAAIMAEVSVLAKTGVEIRTLDTKTEELIRAGGDTPAFLGYRPLGAKRPYPATLCVSINEEAVHGIPTEREYVLKDGDIVSLDTGLAHRGLFTDMCVTVPVGNIDTKGAQLIEATHEALQVGIAAVHAGARTGDIGHAIERFVKTTPFSIVEDLAGHGVGRSPHEHPLVPHTGKKGRGEKLEEGTVITIEPTLSEGSPDVRLASDGFTYLTRDASRTAQFEHTLVVTKNGAEILTKR